MVAFWDLCGCDHGLLLVLIVALCCSEVLPLVAALKGADDEDCDVSDCEEEDEELRSIELDVDRSCYDDLRQRLGRTRGFLHGCTQLARSEFVKKATAGNVDITALFKIVRQLCGAPRSTKQVKRRKLGRKVQHRHFSSAISMGSDDDVSSTPPSSLGDESKDSDTLTSSEESST